MLPAGQLAILDLSSLAVAVPSPSVLFGVFTADPAQFEAVKLACASQKPKCRPCFYRDGPGVFPASVLATAPRYSLMLKELYIDKSETSLPQAVARWDAEAADLESEWKFDLGAILCCYTQNGRFTVPEVEAIAVAGIEHLNRRGPRWKCCLTFAWNRADGGQIAALAKLQQDICAGSPGWPQFIPIPTPPPPVTDDNSGSILLLD